MTKLNNKCVAIKAATHFVMPDVEDRLRSMFVSTSSPNVRKPRIATGRYSARTPRYAITIDELNRLGCLMSH